MLDFNFCVSTNFIFGKDTHKHVGETAAALGVKKVMLVYDSGQFLKTTGILDAVLDSLKSADLTVTELTGVLPNPRLGLVREGVKLGRAEQVEMVIALGGGSTIDTAKAIAAGIPYDGDVWDYFSNVMGAHPVFKALPIGVILTIAATGSESSAGCMITNEDGWLKYGCGGPAMRPTFAIMNPEITCSLPAYQTACGIIDMFSHVAERYFTNTPDTYIIDGMAEGLMRSLTEVGPKLMKDLTNYNYRSEVMWAGTVAHNDTVGVGREQDWATHDLSYEISALYDLTHGSAVAIVLYSWMKYVYKHDITRFVRFAKYVMGINTDACTPEEAALAGIEKTAEFIRTLGLPLYLSEVQIDDSRFEEMADKALAHRESVGFFVPLVKEDILAIYREAL